MKRLLFIVTMLSCAVGVLQAQDTIRYPDPPYMYMPFDSTITQNDHREVDRISSMFEFVEGDDYIASTDWAHTPESYVGYYSHEPVLVYGIAATTDIWYGIYGFNHFFDASDTIHDMFALLIMKEGDFLWRVDSVRCRLKERPDRYFVYPYIPDFQTSRLGGLDIVIPSYEYYFSMPKIVYDTFYVGIRCTTYTDSLWSLPTGWYSTCWGWLDDTCGFDLRKNFLGDTLHIHAPNHMWGGFFPIIEPPDTDAVECLPVEQFRCNGYRNGQPRFVWDTAEGLQEFQIGYGPAEEDPNGYRTIDVGMPPHLLYDSSLDTTVVYAARCRRRCHHTSVVHDTVVWSEWSDTVHFYYKYNNPPIGIGQTEECGLAFTLSPNPARDEVTVNVGQTVALPCTVVLRDEAGRELLRRRINTYPPAARYPSKEGTLLTLSTHGLSAGIYLVTLESSQGSSTQKLIVERN